MSNSRFEIPERLLVEGIRNIGQHAIANKSKLLVPKEFPTKTHVAKWAHVGAQAESAQEPQVLIPGQGWVVDGWAVFKFPKGHKEHDQPCTRSLGGGKVVLLMRPRHLQAAVNAIYGNASRQRTIDEQQGKTVTGQPVPTGVLNEERLQRYDPATEAEGPIGYKFNTIPAAKSATTGGRGRVRTRKAA